ncbi:MAG: peptide-methionine (S)-S-oxide reductase [Candidatus Colwellbacteria bacterium RIFCSPHIGHO2_12_FULL_43_12]|uniref:Peptide methionine sulfoxide reductase MsrA n=3 Tax=Candidatus Colwelliibacteriota TaxID=1817904 RepID=A0A1G1YZJ2_9BACT|nr:MAG: peptide-methionine (S)-S-oxide reductase [Candidatus Colwellbacteria bacterium RIFCSPHIGHO2_02_FULL_43_15]OGY58478.1 MAG: peptide-methionine (S)-S-oxide reductase [Candidatus Colwellbacteria bacterium RIFCSPHIGHO2_12_FULL_43_12]OGY61186.1 MAG: peptide-methionine (S)-S-oxide reductase [Candidatus Colwellbacteria bacterium RIFCSPLOWO2_12_FULL_43_11]
MKIEKIVFAGGCFWCTEAVFRELQGVVSVMPGYAGGNTKDPTYEEVCSGTTGHAEVIEIGYDSSVISLHDLLTVFFATHNPTTLNRQGNDVGTQYRSAIFYNTEKQREEAELFIKDLDMEGEKVVTELKPLGDFYPAEDYHREYYRKNSDAPYCQIIINPKLKKLRDHFKELLNK